MSKYTSLVNSILENLSEYKRTYKQDADLVVISLSRYMDMLDEEGYPDGVHLPPYTPYHPSVSLSQALGVKIVLREDYEAYHTYVFSCKEEDIAYLVGKCITGTDMINKALGIPKKPMYKAYGSDPITQPTLYKQSFHVKSVEAYDIYRKRLEALKPVNFGFM